MPTATGATKNGKSQVKELSQTIIRQLEDRGIDSEMAVKFGLGLIKGHGGSEKLALPFKVKNETLSWKVRSVASSNDGMFWIGQEDVRGKSFFNEDCLRDDSLKDYPLIITEGEIDCLTILPWYPKCVSVPNGANTKSIPIEDERSYSAFEYLNNAIDLLKSVKEIIIATDGDRAGRILLEDLALRLGKPRCRWVMYPFKKSDPSERCKDLNESFNEWGYNGIQNIIEKAKWYPISGVYTLNELPPLPEPEVYRSGMGGLDRHLGIRLGDFSVVTGIPGHGKSTFVNDLCCRMIVQNDMKIAFASFEQPPQKDHRRNLTRWFAQRKDQAVQGLSTSQKTELTERILNEKIVFIVKEEDETADLDWLLEKMSACVIQHDVDIIVIDPYNEIDHKRDFRQTTTDYIGDSIKKIKRFATRYDVHVMVVAHPTKLSERADGTLPIPTLYSLEVSRHWYNKCDVGMVVHRISSDNFSVVRVVKSRYHDILGTPGEVRFDFNKDTGRYNERFEID